MSVAQGDDKIMEIEEETLVAQNNASSPAWK